MDTNKIDRDIFDAFEEVTYNVSVGALSDTEAAKECYEIYQRQMDFVLAMAKANGLDLNFLLENE